MVSALQSSALQGLTLRVGQVLEARVVAQAPNGGTQVQIAGQTLNLMMPALVEAGALLKLEVQAAGPQLKFALQSATPPSKQAAAISTAPAPSGQLTMPASSSLSADLQIAASTPLPSAATVTSAPAVSTSPVQQIGPNATPQLSRGGEAILAQPVPSSAASASVTTTDATVIARSTASPQSSTLTSPQSATPSPATPGWQVPIAAVLPATKPTQIFYQPTATGLAAAEPVSRLASPHTSLTCAFLHEPGGLPQTTGTALSSVSASEVPTPQQALTRMVQSALGQQDSVGKLIATLTAVVGKVALPEPVMRAAQQVLAGRLAVNGGKLDGATLRKAVLSSGLLQEATLAKGQASSGPPDQKTALLGLRQVLTNWLGPQIALTSIAPIAPPLRGQTPRACLSEQAPVVLEGGAEEIGKQLLERTEASLSRLRLHQAASLPDPVTRTSSDWSMDLPLLIGTQQSVLHLQIHRDPENTIHSVEERGWQMRFALSVPQLGEVGAQVSLRGGATGVMLWATERQTSDVLETHIQALRETLTELGLRPSSVIVRHGEPPTSLNTASGQFLDAST